MEEELNSSNFYLSHLKHHKLRRLIGHAQQSTPLLEANYCAAYHTPLLTELLTNNIPARHLLKPNTFLLFATIVYGPVLLLRELAIRWRLGLIGYIVLGFVYGVYNEGLLAKTIFQTQLPNPSFNNYGVLWGINFTWATVIIIFHAFYAFLFPLLIINYFFPSAARKPWLKKRVWVALSAVLLMYISWKFLKNMHPPVTALHYAFLIIVMICLVATARKFKNDKMFEPRKAKLLLLCFYGFVFVVAVFTLSNLIAVSRINPGVFIIYLIAVLSITTILLQMNSGVQSLLVFCLAAEISFAAGALWVAKVSSSRTGIQTSILFIMLFIGGLIWVLLKPVYYFQQSEKSTII